MELDNALGQRVWAYRKAAWVIEDLPALAARPGGQDVGLIHRQMGRKGLESIENVGLRLAEVVEHVLTASSADPGGLWPAVPQRLRCSSMGGLLRLTKEDFGYML